MTDPTSVKRMVQQAREELGPIALLINNAGDGGPFGPTWEADPEAWWRSIETNLRGPFLCCNEVLPAMIALGRGRIVNVASGAGTHPITLHVGVCHEQGGPHPADGDAGDRCRLKQYGVSVFSIQPGTVRTALAEKILEFSGWVAVAAVVREDGFEEGQDVTTEPATGAGGVPGV